MLLIGLTGDEPGSPATLSGSSMDDVCLEHTGRSSSRSPGLSHSCDQVPADEISRITGSALGEPMVPTGFDPNPIGGQLGCAWPDVPGWSAQLFEADLETVPPIQAYAAVCRM